MSFQVYNANTINSLQNQVAGLQISSASTIAILTTVTSSQSAPPFMSFVPTGAMSGTVPTPVILQQYLYNICSYFDSSSQTQFFVPKLTSSIFLSYLSQFNSYIGFDESLYTDINSNIAILTSYSSLMNTQISDIATYTTAGDNYTFGAPIVEGLVWNINPNNYTGNTLVIYQTLRILYTAFSLIGYFYQHHYLPFWIPPYQATGSSPMYFIPYTNVAPNQYAQPGVQFCQGVDCTNFTSLIYYLGLGIYFSSDTVSQCCGNISDLNSWMTRSEITTTLTTASENNYGLLNMQSLEPVILAGVNTTLGQSPPVYYAGAVVVSGVNTPLQSFNNTTAQVGDIAYLSTVSSSDIGTSVSHAVINLGYPYIIDSDNFLNFVTGIFVRNIQKIINSQNTVLNPNIFEYIFLIRRSIGQTGSAPALTGNTGDTAVQITTASVQVS
jgi:hypothetical protein